MKLELFFNRGTLHNYKYLANFVAPSGFLSFFNETMCKLGCFNRILYVTANLLFCSQRL